MIGRRWVGKFSGFFLINFISNLIKFVPNLPFFTLGIQMGPPIVSINCQSGRITVNIFLTTLMSGPNYLKKNPSNSNLISYPHNVHMFLYLICTVVNGNIIIIIIAHAPSINTIHRPTWGWHGDWYRQLPISRSSFTSDDAHSLLTGSNKLSITVRLHPVQPSSRFDPMLNWHHRLHYHKHLRHLSRLEDMSSPTSYLSHNRRTTPGCRGCGIELEP